MHFQFSSLVVATLSLTTVFAASAKPDVDVNVNFPDSNPFGRVTNGVSNNLLQVRLQNHGAEQIVVTAVKGQYREAGGRERVLRNTTNQPLRLSVLPFTKSALIPYKFHCENKIGEVGLRVWVDYLDAGNHLHTVLGYEGNVTVVEPKGSWLDIELLLLYLILGSFFGLIAYAVYNSYATPVVKASSGKTRSKRTPAIATPAKSSIGGAPSDSEGEKSKQTYEEEWIPEHILRQRKNAGTPTKSSGNAATSGEESEGGKRSAKKGKGRK